MKAQSVPHERYKTVYEDKKRIVAVGPSGTWQYWTRVTQSLWFLTPLHYIPDRLRIEVNRRLKESTQ